MGLSSITRYDLFLESSKLLLEEGIVHYSDIEKVSKMYYDSAMIIQGFEEIINKNDEMPPQEEFMDQLHKNSKQIEDSGFIQLITKTFESQLDSKRNSNREAEISYKVLFKYLLKAIAVYQDGIIKNSFIKVLDDKITEKNYKQTFLSYAYDDKGLTQALFYYFWKREGFLYVNWMLEGVNKHSRVTKDHLEKALEKSNQLLFLRTPYSELRVQGNNNIIRQWCSWEIGNFYTKHKEEKYYLSFYDKKEPRNDILDTFRPMKEVILGEINKK